MSGIFACTSGLHNHAKNTSVLVYICPIVGVLAIVGNALVITAIATVQSLQRKSNFLIAALAFADLCVGGLSVPLTTIIIYYGQDISCTILTANNFLTTQFCAASVFLLAAISIDRYMHLSKLMQYDAIMTKTRIALLVIGSWVVATTFAFMFITKMSLLLYHILVTIAFQIPVGVTVRCYWRIFKIVQRKTSAVAQYKHEGSNVSHSHTSQSEQPIATRKLTHQSSKSWSLAKTMMMVVASFWLCWTPFVVYSLVTSIQASKGKEIENGVVYQVTLFLGLLNSATNPFIYCFRQKGIREGVQVVLRKMANVCREY